jgi:adenosylcobinamide kinase/adenosylcobinamide-phosphate guanylyltransferase
VKERLVVVSGPARGGKSRWAEHLAGASGLPVVYLATGPVLEHDPAWQRRLERHRRRRPSLWRCREVEGALAEALDQLGPGELALIDSLGTWVAAHLDAEAEEWGLQLQQLLLTIDRCPAALLVVCEETGWGVVPATAAGGRFRDRLGRVQRMLTERCDAAWLVVQGRAIDLLRCSLPVPADEDS